MAEHDAAHPPPDIVIETLQTTDRDSAHALLCAFKQESQERSPIYDDLRPDYRDILGRYMDEYLSRTDCTIFVAKAEGAIVGMIMGSIWNYLPIYKIPQMGYIPELYIVPTFRRRGVGSALIRATEQWFREQGAKFSRIETITAYDQNQSIYEGLGYRAFLVDMRRQLD